MFKFQVKNKALWADFFLLVMALIWGSGFIATKNVIHEMSSAQLITVRFLLAAVVLGVVNIKRLKKLEKEDLLYGGLIGVVLFVAFLFQTVGLETTSAGKSAFLTSVYVAIVPVLTLVLTRKKPDKYNTIAAVCMLGGIFLLTMNAENGFRISSGDWLTLGGSLFFGLHVTLVGYYSKKRDPITLVILQMAVAGLCAVVYLLATGDVHVEGISPAGFWQLIYLGVVGSGITFLIQNVAQKYTSSTHAGILMSMESVFGTVLGILLLGEVFTLQMAFGAVVIFFSLILAETKLSFLRKKDSGEEIDETAELKNAVETCE